MVTLLTQLHNFISQPIQFPRDAGYAAAGLRALRGMERAVQLGLPKERETEIAGLLDRLGAAANENQEAPGTN